MEERKTISTNRYLTSEDYEEIKFILSQFDLDVFAPNDTLGMVLEYVFAGEATESFCRKSNMVFQVVKRYVLDPKFEAEKARDNGEERQVEA